MAKTTAEISYNDFLTKNVQFPRNDVVCQCIYRLTSSFSFQFYPALNDKKNFVIVSVSWNKHPFVSRYYVVMEIRV